MNEIVKLSIIIPVFNVEDYVEKCYSSISEDFDRSQYEIIFINDGSTDQSLSVINNIAKNNSNVKVVSQINQGLSVARNTGLSVAAGKYIIFLDSDDWLNFSVIWDLMLFAIKKDLDLLSYRLEYFDKNSISIGKRPKHPLEYFKIHTGKQVLIQGFQPSSACLFLYSLKFLNDNKLRFYPGISQQDVEFTTRIMLYAQSVYFSDLVCYNYRRYLGTTSMPNSNLKLEKYLNDTIIVASLMKRNLESIGLNEQDVLNAIVKNYNSVTWNLIWRFLAFPKEVSFEYKMKCINELRLKSLYPIKGNLKSKFQVLINYIFFSEFVLKYLLKFRS